MKAKQQQTQETVTVTKPFCKGAAFDENTLKSSLVFFGSMLLVIFMTLIVCMSTSGMARILSVIVNTAVISIILLLFFNNGNKKGADAVARSEIMYQKKEKGRAVSDSEIRICYHNLKGFLIGLIGTIPFILIALIYAFNAKIQTTDPGALPEWMQTYLRRSDIGDALVQYTKPAGMAFIDILRLITRMLMLPYINLVGSSNRAAVLVVDRLSPVLLLLPAVFYGAGYMAGKNIRNKVHTAIYEDGKKRIQREKRRTVKARRKSGTVTGRTPEQLN